ncbi:alpha/beta fold hydrolase [Segeticoccus rhizosphaerae]|jgi:pimeloyl-ACP methyl ester carboxylesterase|uniref:alpha/beta fold hydrolase n=1 Tax=Segeticoccus rhizosphaerae TaxID=1104777 RepID=UPI0010C01B12|nr:MULTISPECIES: alpha/beta hydrolase [Intrasporangiaceae]
MSIAHRRVGTGPNVVICLPGWFGSSEGWGHWPELLDGERRSFLFTDYRGYGARQDEEGEHTIDEIARDTLALADEVGAQTFSLIGHSMGGSAVQRVLSMAPDRVERMIGISPVPASGVPFDDDGWALFSGAAQSDDNRAAIIDLTTGNRLTRRWIDQMVASSVENSTREAFGDYLEAWAKTDFASEVEGSSVQALAIVGEHDPALGEETINATWRETYRNCVVQVMANAGHYAMFETPVALATSVEAFLDRA